MIILRVNEGEPLPLARPGYERVLVDEFNGLRHAVFIPAECCELHRGHSDIGNAINYIRGQAPGMAIRKVELI